MPEETCPLTDELIDAIFVVANNPAQSVCLVTLADTEYPCTLPAGTVCTVSKPASDSVFVSYAERTSSNRESRSELKAKYALLGGYSAAARMFAEADRMTSEKRLKYNELCETFNRDSVPFKKGDTVYWKDGLGVCGMRSELRYFVVAEACVESDDGDIVLLEPNRSTGLHCFTTDSRRLRKVVLSWSES